MAQSEIADPATGPPDKRVQLIKIADRLHNLRTIRYLPTSVQVDKSLQTLQVHVPAARALGTGNLGDELAGLACATLRRYHQGQTACGRLLRSSTVLLPVAVRARWREEWLAELHQISDPRARATFAAQIALATARLAVTLRRPDGLGRRHGRN